MGIVCWWVIRILWPLQQHQPGHCREDLYLHVVLEELFTLWLLVTIIDSLLAGLQNPIDIMFHLQPLMFLVLFPLFAVFEGA